MKSKKPLVAIPVALVLSGVAFVLLGGRELFRAPEQDNGLIASGSVEATEAHLGFPATGRLMEVVVRQGEPVQRGDELARLDRAELDARQEEARAAIAVARAVLRELQSGFRSEEVAQGLAARHAARRRLLDAERDRERSERLYEGGASSREMLDKAQLRQELAETDLAQAEESLRLLESGPRRERIEAQRAQLARAEASLRTLEAMGANMSVSAPFNGVITARHREPGETVPLGAPVLTLMDPGDRWVRIYVKEDRIGAVKLGLNASISTDSFPGKLYQGTVRHIAPQAEFTPKNVQTTEERVKLVYAVEVQIAGDSGQDLKPGMPADVRLEIDPS